MTWLLIVGLLGGLVVVASSAIWWTVAVRSLFFIAVFEGSVRKWLIPSGSELFYFLKDGVLIGALIGWAVSRRFGSDRPLRVFWCLFGAAALYGLIEVFNPVMASPVVGALGWKAYYLWVGLVLILPDAFATLPELGRYLRTLLVVAVPVCVLAVLQFQLPPTHFLNVYAWDGATINQFGEAGSVRVTGTFPFLTGFSNFLALMTTLLVPMAAVVRDRWVRRLAFVLGPLVLGTALMTGSRSIVFFVGLYFVLLLSLGLLTGALDVARIGRFLLLPAIASALVIVLFFGDARAAFMQRAIGASQVGDTFTSRTLGASAAAFAPGTFSWFGDGIGSVNNAGRIAGSMLRWPSFAPTRPVEAEPNRVMAEVGLFGWIFWYVFKLSTIVVAWVSFLKLRTPLGRALALSIFCFLGLKVMSPLPFDQILAVFYWFAVGVVVGLPRWEAATLQRRDEVASGNPVELAVTRRLPMPLTAV